MWKAGGPGWNSTETNWCSLVGNRYKIIRDPAGWLAVDPDNGVIKVKSKMDRESAFVREEKYTALIGAFDNGRCGGSLRLCAPLTTLKRNDLTLSLHQMSSQPQGLVLWSSSLKTSMTTHLLLKNVP